MILLVLHSFQPKCFTYPNSFLHYCHFIVVICVNKFWVWGTMVNYLIKLFFLAWTWAAPAEEPGASPSSWSLTLYEARSCLGLQSKVNDNYLGFLPFSYISPTVVLSPRWLTIILKPIPALCRSTILSLAALWSGPWWRSWSLIECADRCL